MIQDPGIIATTSTTRMEKKAVQRMKAAILSSR